MRAHIRTVRGVSLPQGDIPRQQPVEPPKVHHSFHTFTHGHAQTRVHMRVHMRPRLCTLSPHTDMRTRAVRPICPHMHPPNPIHDAHVQALPTPAAPPKGFAACQSCNLIKPRDQFSPTQLKMAADDRRCGDCVAATGGPKFVPNAPLERYPLLDGCSATETVIICPRHDECFSPHCGHAHRCSAPAHISAAVITAPLRVLHGAARTQVPRSG